MIVVNIHVTDVTNTNHVPIIPFGDNILLYVVRNKYIIQNIAHFLSPAH